jgi:C4-dicarboxylate-binding protein DctP
MKQSLHSRLSNPTMILAWIVPVFVVLALLSDDAPAASAQDNMPSFGLGHAFSPGSLRCQGLEALKKQLLTEHIASVDLVAPPRLEIPGSLTQAVRTGALDMAVVPFRALTGVSPRFSLFQIPFLFLDAQHVLRVQLKIGPALFEELQKAGLKGVGWWPGEFLLLASRKAVLAPEDLKGLRISAQPPGVQAASAADLFVEKTGALSVSVSGERHSQVFQRGAVDVMEGTIEDLRGLGIPELSVTLTNHLYAGYAVIANQASWARLPGKTQEALEKEFRNAHEDLRKKIEKMRQENQDRLLKEQRASIFVMPQGERELWRASLSSESLSAAVGPDLIRAARDLENVRTAAMSGDGPEIAWNSWLEDSQGKDAPALMANQVYRINLDLARYAYRKMWSSPSASRLYRRLRDQGELRLLLQPVMVGSGMAPAPGRPLDLQKLAVKFDRTKIDPTDRQKLEEFQARKLSTRALSEAVNLGSIASWEVVANESGCADLAISVWDEARIMPLDHIVISFPVQPEGEKPKACRPFGLSQAMGAGMETLLYGPGESIAPSGRRADAALHVFETDDEGTRRSIAVFVDRARLMSAQSNPNSSDSGVYAWKLDSVLSSYVSDQSQLPELIRSAHEAIGLPDSQFPFQDVASELARKIFSGHSTRDQGDAAKALSALSELVASAPEPVVLVRLVSAAGEAIYLPFGLLAAQAKKPVVPKRFTVVQPLQAQSAGAKACVNAWWVARPAKLDGVTGDAADQLEKAGAPTEGMKRLPDHDKLARYLNGDYAISDVDTGEGLILLAHHDQGNLKFSKADRPPARIIKEDVRRSFPPGSVAILAACSTTGKDLETRAIVEKLAARGIEALIISPFAVDADFGTLFALEFEKVVAAERANHSEATLLEVFGRAVQRVAVSFKNHSALLDMALEFQLVGNPDVRLCK